MIKFMKNKYVIYISAILILAGLFIFDIIQNVSIQHKINQNYTLLKNENIKSDLGQPNNSSEIRTEITNLKSDKHNSIITKSTLFYFLGVFLVLFGAYLIQHLFTNIDFIQYIQSKDEKNRGHVIIMFGLIILSCAYMYSSIISSLITALNN